MNNLHLRTEVGTEICDETFRLFDSTFGQSIFSVQSDSGISKIAVFIHFKMEVYITENTFFIVVLLASPFLGIYQ